MHKEKNHINTRNKTRPNETKFETVEQIMTTRVNKLKIVEQIMTIGGTTFFAPRSNRPSETKI